MTNDGGDRYISGQYDSDSQTCTLTYVDITHHRFGGETLDSTESEPITIESIPLKTNECKYFLTLCISF